MKHDWGLACGLRSTLHWKRNRDGTEGRYKAIRVSKTRFRGHTTSKQGNHPNLSQFYGTPPSIDVLWQWVLAT